MAEQEPGGWELLRAIKSIDQRLDNFASNYVPVAVYATLVERVKGVESELRDEKDARERDVASLRAAADESRKAKAQTWTAIGLLAVGAVITVLVSIFRAGAGV